MRVRLRRLRTLFRLPGRPEPAEGRRKQINSDYTLTDYDNSVSLTKKRAPDVRFFVLNCFRSLMGSAAGNCREIAGKSVLGGYWRVFCGGADKGIRAAFGKIRRAYGRKPQEPVCTGRARGRKNVKIMEGMFWRGRKRSAGKARQDKGLKGAPARRLARQE